MRNTNEKLDALLKKEWHKNFRIASLITALFIILAMAILAYSTGNTKQVNASVTGFHSQASESHESFYLVVQLESGGVKKIKAPRALGIKKGDTVILNKRETNLLGFSSYTFNMIRVQK